MPDLIEQDTIQEPSAQNSKLEKRSGLMSLLNFYSRYFDLTTDDFIGHVRLALNPFDNNSILRSEENDQETTELYGSVWVTATLIFAVFVSATASGLVAHALSGSTRKYEYQYDLLNTSFLLFYGYTFLAPLALYAITTWGMKFEQQLSLSRLVNIYGYSNVLWLPITVANFLLVVLVSKQQLVLLNTLQWVVALLSGFITGLSILSKVRSVILANILALANGDNDEAVKKHRILVFVLAGAHIVFTIVVKVCFFGIKL